MPPAPRPDDHDDRMKVLKSCAVLDTEPERQFDDLTELACRVTGAPIALVSLLDDTRQWFKSHAGLEVRETPRDQAFCAYAILDDDPFIVEDATRDERFADNPLVTGSVHLRFYAGVPLSIDGSSPVGTLCVLDTEPRTIEDDQLRALEALARQAAAQLHLRKALADEERASRAKSAFLANISHEIRTPMSAILGYTGMLEGEDELASDAWERGRILRTMRHNAEHLLAIIDDVLDISRIEEGRIEVERVPVSVREVVDDAISMLAPSAGEKGLRLFSTPMTALPDAIDCDPTRLRQILVNLVGNAIKFTRQGRIEVRYAYDFDDHTFRFDVEDTGVGMTPEQLRRVRRFELFTQADESTTREFGGSGMGLHISNRLAQLLGGEMTAESVYGSGSTFSVRIEAPERERCPETEAAMSGDAKPLENVRVLLVEDGPDNQRIIAHHLGRAGADVVCACDGLEAIDKARARAYDLVLMDIQMPVLDGVDATRRLRMDGFRLPIIALTANAIEEERRRCTAAGCDDFLAKPVKPELLFETCAKHLRRESAKAA